MRAWAISRTTCLSNKYKSSARVEKHKTIVYKSSGELTISYTKIPKMHKPAQVSNHGLFCFSFESSDLFSLWKLTEQTEQFCKSLNDKIDQNINLPNYQVKNGFFVKF